MAGGLGSSLNIYFATYFWELTARQISVIVLGGFVSAAVALVLAARISARVGKKRGAVGVAGLAILVSPAPIVLRLLGAFPPNESAALVPTLFAFSTVSVALIITAAILVSSMVADVVEDSETTTGRRSEGIFFAARSFAAKAVSGIGVFLSTILLGVIGFPEGARPGEVDPAVIRNLGVVYVPILVVLYVAFVACLFGYRIDRGQHEENLRRLGAGVPVP